MPTPFEMLTKLNESNKACGMPPAGSLMHTAYMTTGAVPCFTFAGTLLENVAGTWDVPSYPIAQCSPHAGTPAGAFFYFSLRGEPQSGNHGFCVYFWQNNALLIQTYVDKQVPLLQIMSRINLLNELAELRSGVNGRVTQAYQRLFTVPIDNFDIKEFLVANP